MSQFTVLPAGAGANASVGTVGTTAPTSATEVAGVNPSGNLQPLKTDAAGNLLVDIASPVIVSENIAQFGGNNVVTGTGASGLGIPRVTVSNDSSVLVSSLPSIPAGTNAIGSVSVSNFPATQPVSAVSLPLPTGASTAALQSNVQSAVGTSATTAITIQGSASGTPIPVSGSVTASNASIGATGSAVPTSGTYVGMNVGGTLTGITGTANGLKVDGSAVTQPISASALPLPSGAATSALQTTIANNQTNGTQVTTISGTVPLPTGASTAANQTTEIGYLSTIATNTGATATDYTSTGTISALNGTVQITGQGVYTVTASITGTFVATLIAEGQLADSTWVAVPMNVISSNLPYYNVTSVTAPTSLAITGGGFLNVRIRASAYTSGTVNVALDGSLSQQTIIASISTPDMYLTGAAAQTATVNNILPATSGATATSTLGFKSASVQVVSTGTAGTYIFEGSNDNVNFNTLTVYNTAVITGTPITAAITASASALTYVFPVAHAYIRLRIASTITGGSIQAFTKLSQVTFAPPVTQVAQTTAANLATTATIASGTVTTVSSVTSNNTAIPGIIADVASAAITTTTTTAAFTPTNGSSYMVNIPVTAVSGTTPTYSVAIQESADTGTNWYTVYTFPTITTTGSYNSPVLTLTGNRVRYVQTLTGTTPSFTRAINRLQSSQPNMSQPMATTYTDRSGTTSATPSTSTQVAAYNQTRRYFIIQNLSSTASCYINFTSAATVGAGSLYLGPYGSYVMESGTITTEAINIISATASVPFSAKEG